MTREAAIQRLASHRERLKEFGVSELSIFGSVARNQATAGSDIDILVEFGPTERIGLFAFVRLQQFLSELLGAKVDLVTPAALRKELKEQILQEAIRAA